MTIDDAIERNTNIQQEFLPLSRSRDWQAVQLGIEALKRIQKGRTTGALGVSRLLPGETKD